MAEPCPCKGSVENLPACPEARTGLGYKISRLKLAEGSKKSSTEKSKDAKRELCVFYGSIEERAECPIAIWEGCNYPSSGPDRARKPGRILRGRGLRWLSSSVF